ncbi:MAG TPA: hypothetical protein VL475_01835 [Planctomycetaceae bacterium]|nr:hypothetical protein [Planctomycetaceae bacterium]
MSRRHFLRSGVAPVLILLASGFLCPPGRAGAAPLRAGVAKVEISSPDAGPPNDPLYVKALVLTDDTTTAVIATVDAVAIAEIGTIRNDYLAAVRERLQKELKISPAGVMINASHCHGIVCADIAERTVQAVREASGNLVPVSVGVGSGHEDRIMENRRLKLKNGREADMRHAYALPADDEVAGVGPVDPEIGVLRLDRKDGRTLAVVYNFACHPIQGVPNGRNTADLCGFSSRVIEESLGEGAIALFVQGCGGDINPVTYKDVASPRDAEPLGNMLGLSTMKAVRKAMIRDDAKLKVVRDTLALPRAELVERIANLESKQTALVGQLQGTSLNLETFIPLLVRYKVNSEFPSYSSHRYLHDRMLGRNDLDRLDAENRKNMEQYIRNIRVMEELTRVQTNLALLKKHHAQNVAAGSRQIDVELMGLRIGAFVLVTFPGELTVQIGLNIKKRSPHPATFVAGYTNGYIYYAPTAEQLLNVGGAQEDSDCLLAPEWQGLFEARAAEILKKL